MNYKLPLMLIFLVSILSPALYASQNQILDDDISIGSTVVFYDSAAGSHEVIIEGVDEDEKQCKIIIDGINYGWINEHDEFNTELFTVEVQGKNEGYCDVKIWEHKTHEEEPPIYVDYGPDYEGDVDMPGTPHSKPINPLDAFGGDECEYELDLCLQDVESDAECMERFDDCMGHKNEDYDEWNNDDLEDFFNDDWGDVDMPGGPITDRPFCDNGCYVNSDVQKCLPIGTRLNYEDVPSYCNLDGEILPQKKDSEAAENNYECESNSARYGECEPVAEQRTMWKKMFGWLSWIFGDREEAREIEQEEERSAPVTLVEQDRAVEPEPIPHPLPEPVAVAPVEGASQPSSVHY